MLSESFSSVVTSHLRNRTYIWTKSPNFSTFQSLCYACKQKQFKIQQFDQRYLNRISAFHLTTLVHLVILRTTSPYRGHGDLTVTHLPPTPER